MTPWQFAADTALVLFILALAGGAIYLQVWLPRRLRAVMANATWETRVVYVVAMLLWIVTLAAWLWADRLWLAGACWAVIISLAAAGMAAVDMRSVRR